MNETSGATKRLARELGVTRLARVTTLDRCGVEVACAVRPRGHVLQVTQGKGASWGDAVASALGEAAELWAAEQPPLERLRYGHDDDGLTCAFVEGRWLGRSDTALVRAEAVYCPRPGTTWFGPSVESWTSNGLAAHPSLFGAVEHAVLELVERDAIARVLPRGWTTAAALPRLLREAPPLVLSLRERGFEVFLFDLTPPRARLPVAGALLFDRERGPIPLTAGYACRRTGEAAVLAALLEAAQSRLTEVHGARDDVVGGERVAGDALRRALARARPRRRLAAMPSWADRPLEHAVQADVAIVHLATEPVHVVKAIGPTLRLTHLL